MNQKFSPFNPHDYSIVEIARRLGLDVERRGKDHYTTCLWHPDKHPSLSLWEKGKSVKCFPCGVSKTMLQFVASARNCDLSEAAEWVRGHSTETHVHKQPQTKPKPPKKEEKDEPLIVKEIQLYGTKPVAIYDYYDQHVLVCCVAKFTHTKKKLYLPFRPLKHDSDGKVIEWLRERPAEMPAYRQVEAEKSEAVVIVEGEKDADCLNQNIFTAGGKWSACTFCGSVSVDDFDVSFLRNAKRIILWPDSDEPGRIHMAKVFKKVKKVCKDVRLVSGKEDWPHKYDAAALFADHGADAVKEALSNARSLAEPPPLSLPKPPPPEEHDIQTADVDPLVDNRHFRLLGHSDGEFVFFNKGVGDIQRFPMDKMTPQRLLVLAAIDYWADICDQPRNFSFNKNIMAELLGTFVQHVKNIGPFDGRGVFGSGWKIVNTDEGVKNILNLGDRLWCDGKVYKQDNPLLNRNGKIAWMRTPPLNWGLSRSFVPNKKIGSEWLDFMRKVKFTNDYAPYMVGGWTVVAMINPLSRFRPGLYMQGRSGSGKTFITENAIKPIMGDALVKLESGTTEPSLRRLLLPRSVAIAMDENQSDTRNERELIGNNLKLMRLSSYGEGGVVLKADTKGKGVTGEEPLVTMMMFISTMRPIMTEADLNRMALVEMSEQQSKITDKDIDFLTNPQTTLHFRRLILDNLPALLASIKKGISVVRGMKKSYRMADLLGTLLGAACWLRNNGMKASEEQITDLTELFMTNNFEMVTARVEEGAVARDTILNHKITVEVGVPQGRNFDDRIEQRRVSIGYVLGAHYGGGGGDISDIYDNILDPAKQLAKYGVKVHVQARAKFTPPEDKIWIGVNHPEIIAAFKATQTAYGNPSHALSWVGGVPIKEKQSYAGMMHSTMEMPLDAFDIINRKALTDEEWNK